MKTAIVKTSFTSGEISKDLYGRGDLASYGNGAKRLVNVNVLRAGGIVRRSGSVHLATLNSKGRIEIIKKNGMTYLCVFTDKKISIFKKNILLLTIPSPWSLSDIAYLNFTNNKGSLIICSGMHPVQILSGGDAVWTLKSMELKGFPSGVISANNGFPICSGFVHGRFVLAGTKAYPNRIWLSRSGSENDFSLGQGLADEGIDIQLLSGTEERIVNIFAAKNLIVFTNTGEWVIGGDPITPENIVASRHSRIGSSIYPALQPIDAEGDIFFIPSDRRSLYTIKESLVGSTYIAENVVSLSRHLMRNISSVSYNSKLNRMFCVKDDGTLAVMTYDKREGVMAWSQYDTQGKYIDVSSNEDGVYTLVDRLNGVVLERFDKGTLLDATVYKTKAKKAILSSLNNSIVGVVCDGIVRSNKKVLSDKVTLPDGENFMIGLRYEHKVEALPFESGISGKKMRLRKLTLRLKDTASLNINIGKGLKPLPFKKFGTGILNTPVSLFTGDKHITTLGWQTVSEQSLYKIVGDEPLPLTILSIKADISLNS